MISDSKFANSEYFSSTLGFYLIIELAKGSFYTLKRIAVGLRQTRPTPGTGANGESFEKVTARSHISLMICVDQATFQSLDRTRG